MPNKRLPIWKLTCFTPHATSGHLLPGISMWKYLFLVLKADVSPEEARFKAYSNPSGYVRPSILIFSKFS